MADNKYVYFLNTIITSTGPIKSVPTLVGPIFNPIYLDVLTVLSIYTEGHVVIIETEPDKFIKLDDKLALKMMKDYNISNDMIKNLLETSVRIQSQYDKLSTIKDLAEMVIKMLGTPVEGLDSIGLLGRAIDSIVASRIFTNFDEVSTAMDALDLKLSTYTDERLSELTGDTVNNFEDVEAELALLQSALTSAVADIDSLINGIKNGTQLNSFKEVEEFVAVAVEQAHERNKDTILDQGGENEVSAEQLVACLANVTSLLDDVADLDNRVLLTEADILDLQEANNAFKNSTIYTNMLKVENAIKDLQDKTHTQGTDLTLDLGGPNEVHADVLKAFMADTLESLQNLIDSGSLSSDEFNLFKIEMEDKLAAIMNSTTILSFKDVEDAIAESITAVHEQGTDTELDKGGVNNISAAQIKAGLENAVTSFTTLKDRLDAIVKDASKTTFKAIEDAISEAITTVHEQGTDMALGAGTPDEITLEDLNNMRDAVALAQEAGSVIISDQMIADAMTKFLAQTPDNDTIKLDGAKLKAYKLVGLSSAISELNYLAGAKSNVQNQIDAIITDYNAKITALTGSGGFQGYYQTYAALNTAALGLTIPDGIYIVGADETRGAATTLYRYDAAAKLVKFLGTFNIQVRDFTTNPLDLTSETKGVLPKNKLAQAFLDEIQAMKDDIHDKDYDFYLAKGTLSQVSALEIRNCIDKVNYLQKASAANLIDDESILSARTWSSYKIDYLFRQKVDAESVYTKGESDAKYATKNESHIHLNKEIIDDVSADEYGNLEYKGKLVGENLNLLTKSFDEAFNLDTLSQMIYLKDYLLLKGLIYPTSIDMIVKNTSNSQQPFRVIANQFGEDITLLDIVLDPNEEQVYSVDPNIETKIYGRGKLNLTFTIVAYKLSDYIENYDLNYHMPGTDTVLAKGTEDEIEAKAIRRSLQVINGLDPEFLHSRNTDTELDKGGPNNVTAAQIKESMVGAVKLNQSAMILVESVPKLITLPVNLFNKSIIEIFEVMEDGTNNNVSQTINTMISSEVSQFSSDSIDMVNFDGDMKLKSTITKTPTQTPYDGGMLSDIDASLGIPLDRVISIDMKDQRAVNLTKVVQDSAPSGYMRFSINGDNIAKDGWEIVNDASVFGGKYAKCVDSGVPLRFNFVGDSISIIGNLIGLYTCVIKIDGVEYNFNQYGNAKNYRCFNIEGLNSLRDHYCEIYLSGSGEIQVSAIDVNIGSSITAYNETKTQTGGLLFYKDGKYYKYENDTYVHLYDALPSSTMFMTDGLVDLSLLNNIGAYMFRLYTKSIPKKIVQLVFNVVTTPIFIKHSQPISVQNVMKSIDFLSIVGNNVKIVFSLDGGVTWLTSTDSIFTPVDVSELSNIDQYGLDITTFNSIDWSGYIVDGLLNLRIGFLLKDTTSYVSEINIQYDMSAYLKKLDIPYILKNGTCEVNITESSFVGKKLVINKME